MPNFRWDREAKPVVPDWLLVLALLVHEGRGSALQQQDFPLHRSPPIAEGH
jgi:hypothetical protein